MAGSTVAKVLMLFLVLLLFPELHVAGTLASGSSARNLPESHPHLPSSSLWVPQASHHGRRGLGKKDRGPGMPSRAQEGTVVTASRQASGMTLGQRPAGLLQDKDQLLGLALPYPEKEPRSSGWERMRKRGREHKRRRDRLRLHRGSWRPASPSLWESSRSMPRAGSGQRVGVLARRDHSEAPKGQKRGCILLKSEEARRGRGGGAEVGTGNSQSKFCLLRRSVILLGREDYLASDLNLPNSEPCLYTDRRAGNPPPSTSFNELRNRVGAESLDSAARSVETSV